MLLQTDPCLMTTTDHHFSIRWRSGSIEKTASSNAPVQASNSSVLMITNMSGFFNKTAFFYTGGGSPSDTV